MITGPKNHRIPFRFLESPRFRPNLKYEFVNYNTCGEAVLSLVMGMHPKIIKKQKPIKSKYWTIPAMIKFLNKKGYTAERITKNAVLEKSQVFYEERLPITPNHVIIADAEVDHSDASFFLINQNIVWHNFEKIYNGDLLFFLARPPQDLVIVTHPKWR